MFNSDNQNNRLLIYFFFDTDGVVDDYNIVMLKDLLKSSKDLFVVSNGEINTEGRAKFEALGAEVLERPNKGFDVGAYQDAIHAIGWEKLGTYDEVILMNHTIMGPVYPFAEMFASMDAKPELDFWGITKYHEVKYDPYGLMESGFLREHIQSHFIAVRKNMMNSEAFHEYWDNMPVINSYAESVSYHESFFTHHFEKLGFRWDVYVNTDDMVKFSEYPLIFCPKKLLIEKRCPIFKRRSFFVDYTTYITNTVGEPAYELMEYLRNETDYDTNLIWENILRCYNQADLRDALHLNYVLPSDMSKDVTDVLKKRKIALVLHIYYEDLIEETFRYASSMPKEADIFITVTTEHMKEAVEKVFHRMDCHMLKVKVIPNRGRDISCVLVTFNDELVNYDYVCHAHDKKVTQISPETKGASWAFRCFETVLKSKDYVNNILRLFEDNERLGLLVSPPPNHGDFYPMIGNEWGENFKGTKELAEELGIHVPMSKDKPPIAGLGSYFWYRPKAMKLLYDRSFTYDDFPKEPMKKVDGTILHALERIYSFAAQEMGYYPAWCYSDNIGNMEITTLRYMLREMNLVLFEESTQGAFINMLGKMKKQAPAVKRLEDFYRELSVLYNDRIEMSGFDGRMDLLYDDGEGFREDTHVVGKAKFREKSFETNFELTKPSYEEEDESPTACMALGLGNRGLFILEKFLCIIEYTDDSVEMVQVEQVATNGFSFDKKILFIAGDPQIVIECQKDKTVREVTFKGRIQDYVTAEMVNHAINQRIPKMNPKLYYNIGNGIIEENTIKTLNLGTAKELEVEFNMEDITSPVHGFRFDPSDEGMYVLENLVIEVTYNDESTVEYGLKDCTTNGYIINDTVFFLVDDPQLSWNDRGGKPVRKVSIKGDCSDEFSPDTMSSILHGKPFSLAKKLLNKL